MHTLLFFAVVCFQASIDNKLDTPQARVYVATLRPHTPVPARNGHATDRVLIYLDDGVMTRQDGDGQPQKIEFHRGEVRWRPASGAYVAENIGDHPIRILEIDLKGAPSGVPRFQNSIRRWWTRNITRSNLKTSTCAFCVCITVHMIRANGISIC